MTTPDSTPEDTTSTSDASPETFGEKVERIAGEISDAPVISTINKEMDKLDEFADEHLHRHHAAAEAEVEVEADDAAAKQ
jgi:hypothetical protein